MRQAQEGVFARARGTLLRTRTPLALGMTAALLAVAADARAQVGSANVPLPNVLLLLDTSGSFEHMIDGSNPEDTAAGPFNPNPNGNNDTTVNPPLLANCEQAWQAGVPAIPNRWGIAVQALTGTVLDATASKPFYSCVTMDRSTGPTPVNPNTSQATAVTTLNGEAVQYGLRNETGVFAFPYDSGYYLPFHRPVAQGPGGSRCVYSPGVLPGATAGGVGITGGAPSLTDCPNEPTGACQPTDFPSDAIGTFYFDRSRVGANSTVPLLGTDITKAATVSGLAGTNTCSFNQATDGIIDQASTLVRFGLMTFDNDPSPATGVSYTTPFTFSQSAPFTGNWSYFTNWDSQCGALATPAPAPFGTTNTHASLTTNYAVAGLPVNCSTGPQLFELGARNPAAPPWEGRLMGFPDPYADVVATGQSNGQVQSAINALRPYGATPTGALMADAEYYFWGDPTGPGPKNAKPDPYVSGGCRSQYIILLTDGAPNQDLRTACEGTGSPNGVCPYQVPEDTASVLANGVTDTQTGLTGTKVFTYVIGFAVSGNTLGADTGSANCAALAASGALATTCNTSSAVKQGDNLQTSSAAAESPCCSLERIAVAGGTQHAYFADTPGDLNAALAAVLGDITGQLGSRTLPVASPTISYASTGPLTATFLSTFQAATCSSPNPDGTCKVPWQSNGAWSGDVNRQQYTCVAGAAAAAATPVASDDFGADLVTQTARNFLFFNGTNTTTNVSTNALTLRPYLNAVHAITNNLGAAPPLDYLDTFGSNGQGGGEVSNFGQGGVVTGIYSALDANNGLALNIQSNSCQDPYSTGYLDGVSCANLALSFAMAQSTFPTTGVNAADNYLASAYSPAGLDGPNHVGPQNRSTTPLGAILDSTPTAVAVPSAQVRDDSYLAFSTALSPYTLGTKLGVATRDTMLYVASIDGLLHAFDTAAGISSTVPSTAVESWAFIPPAVLPHLVSNYPGANNILLDGSPVVKDVVFSRCGNAGAVCGTPPSGQWIQSWHTMLVAGFGAGGRGYYALDVTDPRMPTSTPPSVSYSATTYPTYVAAGTPAALTGTGPHFQWQITSANLTGDNKTFGAGYSPNEYFGRISATPAIATVYADPTLPPGTTTPVHPQEIGVAILPGGHDGLPVPGKACARELASNAGAYQTSAPLYVNATVGNVGKTLPAASPYNVSDSHFPPRMNVRQWAPSCSGTNSAVAGRSLMVVSVATGQVLAVFARAPSQWFMAHHDSSSWDVPTDGAGATLIGDGSLPPTNQFLNATPLDSPMTGTPVVYPSGVGVVAQSVFIGDADGTMWRFDLSDPNPRNWTGAIFADAYSPSADGSGGDAYPMTASSDFNALNSEAISVEPQIALDSSANLVMNFATGDQTAFDACYLALGSTNTNHTTNSTCNFPLQPTVNFLYSVREARGGTAPYHAVVNWYQQWTSGERVTGPMAVFNGILYFATYVPPGGSSTGCGGGGANLYAWDFAHVSTGACGGGTGASGQPVGCGGAATTVGGAPVDPNFSNPPGQITYTQLQVSNPAITVNTVIPGVSIASTPSCTQTSTTGSDAYTGGSHTVPTAPQPGGYSLMANIGKGKKTAAQNLVTQKLQAPAAPTIVDSWAAVAE